MTPVKRGFLYMAVAAALSFASSIELTAQSATFASLVGAESSAVATAELEARAADNLRLAGYLAYYQGRSAPAITTLTRAAEAYLAAGDMASAIGTFIDAAWVAAAEGDQVEASVLGERALKLTRSPLLAATDREALVRRLGH